MMETQYIRLNMVPSGVIPILNISQYDVGRVLGVYVFCGIRKVNLDNYTVTVEATRSDGTAIIVGVTTTNNVGTFEVTPVMSNLANSYRAQLVITDENSRRIASLPFIINVIRAAMNENSEAIEEDATLYQQYTDAMQSIIAETKADLVDEATERQANIDAEIAARQSADNALQSNINAEISARTQSDNTLQANIENEISNRQSADTTINARIDNIVAPSGEAPSAAEVTDARVGENGIAYQSLGTSIRTQVGDLKNALNNSFGIINNNANRPTFNQGTYGSNGKYVVDSHQITTDLLKYPSGTTITVKSSNSALQTVLREYEVAANGYSRTKNITQYGGTISIDTDIDHFYTIGLYNTASTIDISDASCLSIQFTSPITELYTKTFQIRASASTDCNDYIENGVYQVNADYTNIPTDMTNNGALLVFGTSLSRVIQILSQNTAHGNRERRFWIRSANGNTFDTWTQIADFETLATKGFMSKNFDSGEVVDANTLTNPGIYYIGSSQTASNVPDNVGTLASFMLSNIDRGGQLFFGYHSNNVWYRINALGTWFPWINIARTSEQIGITYESENNYIINFGKYNMKLFYTEKSSADQYNWNIGDIRYNDDVVVPKGTDIIGPIKIIGDDDFLSGVHGSSTTTNIKVFCDESPIELNDSLSKACEKITIYMIDECRRTTDLSHVFDRFVTIEITKDKIHVTNTYKNISGETIQVERATNGGLMAVRNNILQSTAMQNCMLLEPPTTAVQNANKKNTHAIFNTLYGSITVDNIIGHEESTYAGCYKVFVNENPIRTKTYFDVIASQKAVLNDELIVGEFEYNFK